MTSTPHITALPTRNETFRLALEGHLNTLSSHERFLFVDPNINAENVAAVVARQLNDAHRDDNRLRRGLETMARWVDALRVLFSATDVLVSSDPTIAALVWGGVRIVVEASACISLDVGCETHHVVDSVSVQQVLPEDRVCHRRDGEGAAILSCLCNRVV
jgi:hypothetical protein